jgi:hypothetical protein
VEISLENPIEIMKQHSFHLVPHFDGRETLNLQEYFVTMNFEFTFFWENNIMEHLVFESVLLV